MSAIDLYKARLQLFPRCVDISRGSLELQLDLLSGTNSWQSSDSQFRQSLKMFLFGQWGQGAVWTCFNCNLQCTHVNKGHAACKEHIEDNCVGCLYSSWPDILTGNTIPAQLHFYAPLKLGNRFCEKFSWVASKLAPYDEHILCSKSTNGRNMQVVSHYHSCAEHTFWEHFWRNQNNEREDCDLNTLPRGN